MGVASGDIVQRKSLFLACEGSWVGFDSNAVGLNHHKACSSPRLHFNIPHGGEERDTNACFLLALPLPELGSSILLIGLLFVLLLFPSLHSHCHGFLLAEAALLSSLPTSA